MSGPLARYRIERVLGEGGMGVVVAAHDLELDRAVAIKFARGALLAEPRTRLLREARSLARLNHPNVVTVFDSGTVDDDFFIVMELVDGGTLRDWLLEPRRWRDILDKFLAAGWGLMAAHEAALVHRDFELALKLAKAADAPVHLQGQIEFDLGKALWESRRDRTRATALVRGARPKLVSDPHWLSNLDAWMKQRSIRG
ncbi:MAG: serine/threonine-protein kinase [Kofleriaceae bacterium]